MKRDTLDGIKQRTHDGTYGSESCGFTTRLLLAEIEWLEAEVRKCPCQYTSGNTCCGVFIREELAKRRGE